MERMGENGQEHNAQFEAALMNFINAFVGIPYDEMTDEQKELADKAKAYIENRRPKGDTIH